MTVRVTAYFDSRAPSDSVWEFPAATRRQIERIVLGFAENRGLHIVEENGIRYEELSPRRHLRSVE